MNVIASEPAIAGSARSATRLPWPALLGPMTPADAEALDTLAVTRAVACGSPAFQRGAPARHLVALIDGQVLCGCSLPGRGLNSERFVQSPDWLALAGPWHAGRHACDAVAQSTLLLAELPLVPLRSLLVRRPLLAVRLVEAMAREVVRLDERLHELLHKDAAARLATWLAAQLAERAQPELRLAGRKRDIASQLGMTPETLSRMMRNLSDQGLIAVDGYTVRVLEPGALKALAQS